MNETLLVYLWVIFLLCLRISMELVYILDMEKLGESIGECRYTFNI